MQPFFRLLQVGTFQELQTLRSLDLSNCLLEAEKPLEVAVAVGVPMLVFFFRITMGNPPVNGLTLWIRGWLCCFFWDKLWSTRRFWGFPVVFQRNPHESNTKRSHSIPHLQVLRQLPILRKLKARSNTVQLVFLPSQISQRKINQNNQRSCERLHSGNYSNLKMVHVPLCGWYASFQGFFAAVPILPFSFPGEWQSLHRSRQHYGPSQDLGAVLFDAEPGRSRCTCTISG